MGTDNRQVVDIDDLAQWAIEKENRINFGKSLHKTPTTSRKDNTPRNPDGTYRQINSNNKNQWEPKELHATRRRPPLNISRDEFQRRMREQICLKCGKPGHRAAGCTITPKPFNPQARPWQQNKKNAPWQGRQQIREIEIESIPKQSGNEECLQ